MIYTDVILKKRTRVTPGMSPMHPLFVIYSQIDKLNNELDGINNTYNHRIHGLPVPGRIIEINKEKAQLAEQARRIFGDDSLWDTE